MLTAECLTGGLAPLRILPRRNHLCAKVRIMDRKFLLLCAAAIPLGLAGGYAWSVYTAPAPKAYHPPKATMAPIADSPDEYPAALDDEWQNRGGGAAARHEVAARSVTPAGCSEVTEGDSDVDCEPAKKH